jgi:hypothetical protein
MTTMSVLDAAGRRRSPATMPGYHAGRPPRNKGIHYPADRPTVDEIVAVMRHTAENRHGWRLRAMIVSLWRAGLRVQEALALAEHDLDPRRGSILVRCGKGGRRREVGMDDWGWEELRPWLDARTELPVGRLFCIIDGPTRGRPWSSGAVRTEFRRVAARACVRRRFAPHQLRHAHALEPAREGVPLNIIQRQLGHLNLGTTSMGRDGARCRRYRGSVSPPRPPNRTCTFPPIRLSTGHAMAARDRCSGSVDSRSSGGSSCCGGRPRRGDAVASVAIPGHRDLVGPGEPRAVGSGPAVPPVPSPDLFPGQPRMLSAQPADHPPPQVVAEIRKAAAARGVAIVVGPSTQDGVEHMDQPIQREVHRAALGQRLDAVLTSRTARSLGNV